MATLDELETLIDSDRARATTGAAPINVETPFQRGVAAVGGGALGVGDVLTFGLLGNLVAGGAALPDVVSGVPFSEAFAQRKAETAAMKDFYRQQAGDVASVGGVPITELGAGFLTPGVSLTRAIGSQGLARAVGRGSAIGAAQGAAEPLIAVDVPEEERMARAQVGGTIGGVLGGALGALSKGAAVSSETAKGLQRRARGVIKSDYKKVRNNAIVEDVAGNYETKVKTAMDDLIEAGDLGPSLDPEDMYAALQENKSNLENSIQDVLKAKDAELSKRGKAGPISAKDLQFPRAMEFIEKSNLDPRSVDSFLNEIDSLKDAIIKEGQGSLQALNRYKRGIGESWSDLRKSQPTFWRAIYTDLKSTIEKYAPEVAPLNKSKQKFLIAEPIIGRGVRSAEDVNLQGAERFFYTTGGSGLVGALKAGEALGSPGAAVLANYGLRQAATSQGMEAIAQALQAMPVISRGAERSFVPSIVAAGVTTPVGQGVPSLDEELLRDLELLGGQKKNNKMSDSQIPTGDRYAPESLVRAVMQVESGGRQSAVSPKGARGKMQLMPATARELGVDPNDPVQNVEGGSRYLKQQLDTFGDTNLALAAYNMGPGALRKAIEAAGTSDWDTLVRELGEKSRYNPDGLPLETINYVRKVNQLLA